MAKTLFSLLLLTIMLSASVLAGPWDLQDKGSEAVAAFAEAVLGEEWKEVVTKNSPDAEITWGARGVPSEQGAMWVVYAEVKPNKDDPTQYFFFEISMKNIIADPVLKEKYGV